MEIMALGAIRLLWRRGEQGIVVIERSVHLNNLGATGAVHLSIREMEVVAVAFSITKCLIRC